MVERLMMRKHNELSKCYLCMKHIAEYKRTFCDGVATVNIILCENCVDVPLHKLTAWLDEQKQRWPEECDSTTMKEGDYVII